MASPHDAANMSEDKATADADELLSDSEESGEPEGSEEEVGDPRGPALPVRQPQRTQPLIPPPRQ